MLWRRGFSPTLGREFVFRGGLLNLGFCILPKVVSVNRYGWHLVNIWPRPRSKLLTKFSAKSVCRLLRKGAPDATSKTVHANLNLKDHLCLYETFKDAKESVPYHISRGSGMYLGNLCLRGRERRVTYRQFWQVMRRRGRRALHPRRRFWRTISDAYVKNVALLLHDSREINAFASPFNYHSEVNIFGRMAYLNLTTHTYIHLHTPTDWQKSFL